MRLVIVESPSKAKTISKYLGPGFKVLASVGHVRDLPKSNAKAIDIEGGFVPHYEVVPKKEAVIAEIRRAAGSADEVLIATDPDREGEAIAWHLQELLTDKKLGGSVPKKKIERITYHEVTKEAVEEALKHPRPIDERLREAQEARRVLDRLVGYDLSGLIWKKVRYGLSAGRVQSPALRIIMEREREIRAFVPEGYWTISGRFTTAAGAPLSLTCAEEPRDEKEAERILAVARAGTWKIADVEATEAKRSPRAPFITSTLQQAASSRLGFSPSRTMGIAQKLYEAGHITYMRTDSTVLSSQALGQIAAAIEKGYGKEYLQFRRYSAASKNAQEAHEAIRPSKMSAASAGSTDEQKRLYRLIWQRAIASQMADARIARTKIVASVSGGGAPIPEFAATGSRVIYDGWLRADPESGGEDVSLPPCAAGEPLALVSADAEAKQTQPPARYTEAGLIKELEKRGIGRPSTYASICRTIEERGYVEKEGRALKPTDTGDVVSSFLEEYFPSYIGDTFTAEMENELDEIANGERTYTKTLSDFYGPFSKEVKAKEKLAKATSLGAADPKFKCPVCGSPMEIKLGRNGKFLSCSRYPDCDGALTIDGVEFKKDEPIGTDPSTGLPIFVLNGRFGPYVQLGVKPEKKAAGRKKKGEGKKEKGEAAAPKQPKPKMASIPKGKDPTSVTVADALVYLSLPRSLGADPATGKEVTASIGRFGPYVVRDDDFRSVKPPLDIYAITLDQALALLAQEKKARGFARRKKA
ncbi:MAG: type I DNA topoisomerase [Patescibacteria group bacterium]|nr:type I DNA topoisomerase [Patescibacteria group bacterium]